jgi:hypothetical protein
MTQDRLLKLLEQPEQLAFIPYEELKTLALAYPYAHNLRYLLALKAKNEDHPDQKKLLATAAAYSLDRTRLFTLCIPIPLNPQKVEEVLELKPLDDLLKEREQLNALHREEILEKKSAQVPTPVPMNPPPSPTPEPVSKTEETLVKSPSVNPPKAQIVLGFNDWYSAFNVPSLEYKPLKNNDIEKKESPAKEVQPIASAKSHVAQVLAEKSVSENKDVISETLARLLAKQGYTEKAIAMYERLSLAFPDRHTIFAAEIDKLKK